MEIRYNISTPESQEKLLKAFNLRDEGAYVYIYELYFSKLMLFASRYYAQTEIVPADLIHDIFLSVWERRSTIFNSLSHIEGYLYLSIRNHYKKYIQHRKHVDKYAAVVLIESHVMAVEIVEIEVLSQLSMLIDTLPEECAKVLKLYIEGWETKEIAEKLGKATSTVYNQKNEAVTLLRKRLNGKLLIQLISLIN